MRYGEEVEERIARITEMLQGVQFYYPQRYVAVKLLEGDEEIAREVARLAPQAVDAAKELAGEIENLHGHPCSTVITSERYEAAGRVVRQAQKLVPPLKPTAEERASQHHNTQIRRIPHHGPCRCFSFSTPSSPSEITPQTF